MAAALCPLAVTGNSFRGKRRNNPHGSARPEHRVRRAQAMLTWSSEVSWSASMPFQRPICDLDAATMCRWPARCACRAAMHKGAWVAHPK